MKAQLRLRCDLFRRHFSQYRAGNMQQTLPDRSKLLRNAGMKDVFGKGKATGVFMKLKNVNIYHTEDRCFVKGGLTAENGVITGFSEEEDAWDAGGAFLLPGLVDTHTHGRAGYDFSSANAEEMLRMEKAYAEVGTTTVIPTIATAPPEQMLEAVRRVRQCGFSGVHIEGRYLSPLHKGAHSEALLHAPDIGELEAFMKAAGTLPVRITVACELPGGTEFIRAACRMGAFVSLGHTDAGYDEAMCAVQNGVSCFTHLYNAMRPFHHRDPGTVGAGLMSDAYAELICDGFHLHPAAVRLANRVKHPGKINLITDSMEATGCPDGSYSIAGSPVQVRDGKALTESGAIAGSTLNLFDGLLHYAEFCGIPLEEAIPAATLNPARSMGIDGRIGSLAVGKQADLLLLAPDRKTLLAVAQKGKFLHKCDFSGG